MITILVGAIIALFVVYEFAITLRRNRMQEKHPERRRQLKEHEQPHAPETR